MQPLIATFDPYDQTETKTWLDAFAELKEKGPQGNLHFANAGVFEFEFVSGHNDEWVNDLKDKMNEQLATSYPTSNPLPQIAGQFEITTLLLGVNLSFSCNILVIPSVDVKIRNLLRVFLHHFKKNNFI